MAYNYLHILLDVVNMLEEDLKTKSNADLAIGEPTCCLYGTS